MSGLFDWRMKFYAPASDGGDDSGAGDGGEGPKPISEEDVGRIVNSAVTSQLKRLVPAALTEAMSGLDEKITSAVAAVAPKAPEKKKGDEDEGNSGARVTTKDLEAQLRALQQRLDSAETAREQADRARIELEEKGRNDTARASFRDLLQPKVNPDLLGVAVDHFARSRLRVAEDGSTTLTVQRAPYKGAPLQDEDLPLAEAMPLFLASNEIKPFLPAPGGNQEGGNAHRRTRQSPGKGSTAGVNGSSQEASVLAALESHGLTVDDLG